MPEAAVSALDGPLDQTPDADEFIQAAMEWHFDPTTGSQFWIERAESLDFDPRTDVSSVADLTRFPNVADELRDVAVRDLIPRGYGSDPQIVGVFESGGTTGGPKRVVLLQDWVDQSDAWVDAAMDARDIPRGVSSLSMAPTGPHAVGHAIGRIARRRADLNFCIDLDPRWVRKSMAAGKTEETGGYFKHVIEQAGDVLRTQDIAVLATTPPVLEQMTLQEDLADLIREKVKVILWSGTHMEPETRDLLQREVFPDIPLYGVYGNSMMLTAIYERSGDGEDDRCVFDPPAPWVTFSIVDPETAQPVPYGERGRLLIHHVSKSFLLPNNLERDVAVRTLTPEDAIGDSAADIGPVGVFGDEAVVEGAY